MWTRREAPMLENERMADLLADIEAGRRSLYDLTPKQRQYFYRLNQRKREEQADALHRITGSEG